MKTDYGVNVIGGENLLRAMQVRISGQTDYLNKQILLHRLGSQRVRCVGSGRVLGEAKIHREAVRAEGRLIQLRH